VFGVLSYNEFKDAWEMQNPLAFKTYGFTDYSTAKALIKHFNSVISHASLGVVIYSCTFAIFFYFTNLLLLRVYRKHAR
jgi:UDP-N-acetylglucosamine transferase subunit ALG13